MAVFKSGYLTPGKQGWLETHLWHSKRFRMSEEKEAHYSKWGCRVALKPYQKSFRPSYRAIAKHCAVQVTLAVETFLATL